MMIENAIEVWPQLEPWAVVGVSNDKSKYGNKIFFDMKNAGYKVYAVHPKLTEVDGVQCYPDILSLPEIPAVVDLVIPPQTTLEVIKQCAEKGVQRIWFQPGSESEEAVTLAQSLGIQTLTDACIMIQKKQFA